MLDIKKLVLFVLFGVLLSALVMCGISSVSAMGHGGNFLCIQILQAINHTTVVRGWGIIVIALFAGLMALFYSSKILKYNLIQVLSVLGVTMNQRNFIELPLFNHILTSLRCGRLRTKIYSY